MKSKDEMKWFIVSLIGVIVLTIEMLMVVIIQKLEKISGEYFKNVSAYFQEPIIYCSLGIIVVIIIGGLIMFFREKIRK